ncbi:hypothetical protein [Novipirellula galeiformis]|uniref:hypothetical protein n=1 Tax=Novipirellula galeiformis TaxID=2528004 RepID=UPI0018CF93B0|nr:hypothetical protein [Novipirellula galeiformis]
MAPKPWPLNRGPSTDPDRRERRDPLLPKPLLPMPLLPMPLLPMPLLPMPLLPMP